MIASSQPDRHLSPQGFADYLAADVPVVLPVAGQPAVSIFIDPVHERIGLRAPIESDAAAPASLLENLHVSIVNADGVRQIEIASTARELFADVYPMLCAVADRIQLDGNAPLAALDTTLDVWGRVLARRKRLSDDQEVGLFGELLILLALIEALDSGDAVDSWRGPQAEEHDFGFAELDLEVKTTVGELRQHWINNLTQLVPSLGRRLWLVSVQITRAGHGHGRTLPELIDAVRTPLTDAVTRARFEHVLASLRWDDDQPDLYPQRWSLRSQPRAYHVDASFPALTSASMTTLGLSPSELTQVRYELDVTHRPSADPPEPLTTALQRLT